MNITLPSSDLQWICLKLVLAYHTPHYMYRELHVCDTCVSYICTCIYHTVYIVLRVWEGLRGAGCGNERVR